MKATIRETLLAKRLALSPEAVKDYSQSLVKQIRALSSYQQAQHIGIFAPIKNEPDLMDLVKDAKQFYLPKVIDTNMIYVAYTNNTQLIRSPLGILEPASNDDASDQLDLIIIPGIAFDPSGQRIGFGKGFFDRFLTHTRPKHVVGVAYPFQIEKQLHPSPDDKSVDLVLIA